MKRRTLLLLEADPQVCGAYELFLSAHGYSVMAESSVASAMRAAAGKRPVAAIVGGVPDTEDVDTIVRRLRAVVSPHPLAVIVLSPTIDEIPAADIVIPRAAHPRALLGALRTSRQYTESPGFQGRAIRPT